MVDVNEGERWWASDWVGNDELEEEVLSSPSLWEAEVAALSDEQLAALEETAEDV
jgi:hypothetical protein